MSDEDFHHTPNGPVRDTYTSGYDHGDSTFLRPGSMAWQGAVASETKFGNPGGGGLGLLLLPVILAPPLAPIWFPVYQIWLALTYFNWHPVFKIIICGAVVYLICYAIYRFYKRTVPLVAFLITIVYFELAYWGYFYFYGEIDRLWTSVAIAVFGYLGAGTAILLTKICRRDIEPHSRHLWAFPVGVSLFISLIIHPFIGPIIMPHGRMHQVAMLDDFSNLTDGDVLETECSTTYIPQGTEVIFFSAYAQQVAVGVYYSPMNLSKVMSPDCLRFKRHAGAEIAADWSNIVPYAILMPRCNTTPSKEIEAPLGSDRWDRWMYWGRFGPVRVESINKEKSQLTYTDFPAARGKSISDAPGCFRPASEWETWYAGQKLRLVCPVIDVTVKEYNPDRSHKNSLIQSKRVVTITDEGDGMSFYGMNWDDYNPNSEGFFSVRMEVEKVTNYAAGHQAIIGVVDRPECLQAAR